MKLNRLAALALVCACAYAQTTGTKIPRLVIPTGGTLAPPTVTSDPAGSACTVYGSKTSYMVAGAATTNYTCRPASGTDCSGGCTWAADAGATYSFGRGFSLSGETYVTDPNVVVEFDAGGYPVRAHGNGAPASADCDAVAEGGRRYFQDDATSNGEWFCKKTGASTVEWQQTRVSTTAQSFRMMSAKDIFGTNGVYTTGTVTTSILRANPDWSGVPGLYYMSTLAATQYAGFVMTVPEGWVDNSAADLNIELFENTGCVASDAPSHSIQYAILTDVDLNTYPTFTTLTPLGYTAVASTVTTQKKIVVPITLPTGTAGKTVAIQVLRNTDGVACTLSFAGFTINWKVAVQ